jgi:hypothetical protein
MRVIVCLVLVVLLSPRSAIHDVEPIYEIPFDFATRQPIVPVRVNGSRPVPFLFDTGASIHVVDEAIAREAGVVGTGARSITGGGQARVPAQFAESLTFETRAIA